MAEKFDEFSKHLAKKHSRRGAFKLFGAGIIGAAAATAFGKTANAIPAWNQTFPNMNQTLPNFNGNFNQSIPQFNQVFTALEQIAEKLKKKGGIRLFFPWFH